MPEEE